jgi:3-hydroxyacyl-[acyl-carrier-protein] dehydratase
MEKAKVFLRYCGGCNPRYDRVAAVEHLKKCFPQLVFCPYDPDEKGCAALIVCGCTARCPAQGRPLADVPTFVMSGPDALGEAIVFFENIRKEAQGGC